MSCFRLLQTSRQLTRSWPSSWPSHSPWSGDSSQVLAENKMEYTNISIHKDSSCILLENLESSRRKTFMMTMSTLTRSRRSARLLMISSASWRAAGTGKHPPFSQMVETKINLCFVIVIQWKSLHDKKIAKILRVILTKQFRLE